VQDDDDDAEEMLPPYQDDETLLLRSKGPACVEKSPEEHAQMSRQSKTTSRTYTDSDGNVITEVCHMMMMMMMMKGLV